MYFKKFKKRKWEEAHNWKSICFTLFVEPWERITQKTLLPTGCASCEQQAAEAARKSWETAPLAQLLQLLLLACSSFQGCQESESTSTRLSPLRHSSCVSIICCQHIYLTPWGAGGSYHTPLPPHTQQCHHLPWTDLQISTPETCSFPMYPTAKGHQFVPTDFPHNPTQRLLFFWLFLRFGLNTQLLFHVVFKRKFSCATSVYCLNLQR